MLHRRAFAVAAALAVAAPLFAQTGPEWVQPSPRTPEYWELVGRMFGETSAVNDDRSLRLITDPAVIGLANIKATAKPREVLARFAEITYNTTDDNQIDFAQPKLVVKDVREVRVLLAGKAGIAVEWRSGSSSFQHKQCIDSWIARTAFLIDARWRAIAACERGVVWSAWQRPIGPPLPFTTTHLVDGWTALDLTYDPATETVSVALRKP